MGGPGPHRPRSGQLRVLGSVSLAAPISAREAGAAPGHSCDPSHVLPAVLPGHGTHSSCRASSAAINKRAPQHCVRGDTKEHGPREPGGPSTRGTAGTVHRTGHMGMGASAAGRPRGCGVMTGCIPGTTAMSGYNLGALGC